MVCKTGQAALIGRLSVLNEYYLCECLFGGCDFGDGGSFLGETPFPFFALPPVMREGLPLYALLPAMRERLPLYALLPVMCKGSPHGIP